MSGDMYGWDDLRLFLAVAREGGLSPAARLTQSSPATLSRRMLALEQRLGRELFVRHDRGYTLTAAGQALRADLADVEGGIARAMDVPQRGDLPLVKVSAGTWTTLLMLEKLGQLVGSPADIRVRFVSAEALMDMAHREVMIGFRNQRPTEPNLAGRMLSRVAFAPYARVGAPDVWIKVLADTPSARWVAKNHGLDVACEVTAPRNGLDLAVAGQGIAVLPAFIGDAQTALRRRAPVISQLSHDQWIVSHQDDRHLPHVRRAIDRLCEAFGQAK